MTMEMTISEQVDLQIAIRDSNSFCATNKLSAACCSVALLANLANPYFISIPQIKLPKSATSYSTIEFTTTRDLGINGHTKALNDIFKFKNREDINMFLGNNPGIKPFLIKISENVFNFFPNHSLSLEFIPDYDSDIQPQLAVMIETRLSVDEALNKLDDFDENWWLDIDSSDKEKVFVALEYI